MRGGFFLSAQVIDLNTSIFIASLKRVHSCTFIWMYSVLCVRFFAFRFYAFILRLIVMVLLNLSWVMYSVNGIHRWGVICVSLCVCASLYVCDHLCMGSSLSVWVRPLSVFYMYFAWVLCVNICVSILCEYFAWAFCVYEYILCTYVSVHVNKFSGTSSGARVRLSDLVCVGSFVRVHLNIVPFSW